MITSHWCHPACDATGASLYAIMWVMVSKFPTKLLPNRIKWIHVNNICYNKGSWLSLGNCCRTSTSSDATSADLQIRHQYQRHVWILFVISSAKLSQACFKWEVSHVLNLLEHQNGAGTDDPPVPWCASVNCIEQWSSNCEPWLWNFRQQLYQTKILIHFQKTLAPSMLQDCQWPGCILEINCCSKTVTPCHGKNHQEMVLDSRVLLSNSVKVKYCASSNAMLTHDIWSKPNSHGVTCQTTHLPAPCCDRTQ